MKKIGAGVFGVVLILLTFAFAGKLVGKNNDGRFQVIQTVSGDIQIRNQAGYYFQKFADVSTYPFSGTVYFSSEAGDGEQAAGSESVSVRFSDGSTALVSGILKYRIKPSVENQRKIHRDSLGNPNALKHLVRQAAIESLMQTASLIKAEDAYSTRRSDFKSIAEQQILRGIFKTRSIERKTTDGQGRVSIERIAELVLKDGKPVADSKSIFEQYGLEVVQFSVKGIEFDAKVNQLIADKKAAEQAKVVAMAQAEEAKQNTITETEKGKARFAKAKANELVSKVTEVTRAEKEKAVAELNAQRELVVARLNKQASEENAKGLLIKKQAEAKANTLLVKAGLTPLERATIEMKTKIGVAGQLKEFGKNISTVITGGSNGGTMSPLEVIGINQLMDLTERVGRSNSAAPKKKAGQ